MNKNIHTFIGCDFEYSDSNIVIFGAPFDGTTSYRPGARLASSTMRNESFGIETYSPYQDADLEDMHVFDGGDLPLCFGNTERVLQVIENFTKKIFNDNKIPGMIGGEHLVSLGAVRSAYQKYPDLHIIQFDAHADLRDDYLGESLSHATVMRRCVDLLGERKVFQFGIRSGERNEFLFAKENTFMNKFDFSKLNQAINLLQEKPVYLTIDLDVLDSSIFPATGTPEAGGVCFNDMMQAIINVSKLNIIGFDINELSPVYDVSGASTALACKLLRELLIAIGLNINPAKFN